MADDKDSKLDAIHSKLSLLKDMSSNEHRIAFSNGSYLKCESCMKTISMERAQEGIDHEDDCLIMKWIKELDAEYDAEYERVYGKIEG